MLFDALLTRALGQKNARQDIDPSAPNRAVSSKVFFAKFPKLRAYLLTELQRNVSLLDTSGDIVNTGLYPILTLLCRLDVTRTHDSRKYVGMRPFGELILKCMGSKIWKVRAMAARCLPVVVDPDELAQKIGEMFREFGLERQNELHGGLMGIKRLGEFYSYRTLRGVVIGMTFGDGADLDAIIAGVEQTMEMLLRGNPNPLTKGAFVEFMGGLLRKEEKAKEVREKTVRSCLEDIRTHQNSPVGAQMYLEQATTIILNNISSDTSELCFGTVLLTLFENENEEVLLKTLSWILESKAETLDMEVKRSLRKLAAQDKWDGVRALSLQTLAS